jgi:purine catabolism regulator
MKVTLSDVLQLSVLRNAQVVSTPDLITRPVADIMIMEGHDVEKWVEPDEIILTSLVGYTEETESTFVSLFRRLGELQCAAVIVKLGRYLQHIPPAIKKVSMAIGLPLILIDNHIRYRDIMLQVMELLFTETNRQLRYYREINQQYVALMAESPNTRALLQLLSTILGNPVTIVGGIRWADRTDQPDGTISHETVTPHPANKLHSRSYFHHAFTRASTPHSEVLTKLNVPGTAPQFLCIAESSRPLSDSDYIAVDTAVNFISLQQTIQTNLENVKRTQFNDAIDSVINETHETTANFPAILSEHGFDPTREFFLVYCEAGIDGTADGTFFEKNPVFTRHLILNTQSRFPHCLYRIWPNRLLFIIQADMAIDAVQAQLLTMAQQVTAEKHQQYQPHVVLSPKIPFAQFKETSEDCLSVLLLASIIYADKPFFVVTKNDLGIYQLLLNHLNTQDLEAVIPTELLAMHRAEPDLVDTLHAFIAHLYNVTDSADNLYIHPKTMSYRLKKMTKKYHIDLRNADTLANLMIGINLLKLI